MTNMYHSLLFMTFYDLGLDNEIKFDKRYISKQLLILKEVNMNYISPKEEMLKVKRWPKDTIAAGRCHTVGLKRDGTVTAVGNDKHNQCDVSGWRDIVAIAAGTNHTIGLKSNGTVVAVGWNEYGQCNVSDWRDIVAIAAGCAHTVGLKSDGTVIAVGNNEFGQCDVGSWRDIRLPGK